MMYFRKKRYQLKVLFAFVALALLSRLGVVNGTSESESRNFFDFTAVDIDNNVFPMSDLKGKVVLVVNVASACGYTDGHYKALVKLHNRLSPGGRFTVLAFPCNQFGMQEPMPNQEIKKFATEKYDVDFPMFSKVNVKLENVPALWIYLTAEANAVPTWNFWKYLVSGEGKVVGAWGPRVSVEEITPFIMEQLDRGKGHDGAEL